MNRKSVRESDWSKMCKRVGAEKLLGVKTDGKWKEEDGEGGVDDGGWEQPYESNYNDWCCLLPFPLASFILWRWKTQPPFLCVTDECYRVVPRNVIISLLPLILKVFVLPLTYHFPPPLISCIHLSCFFLPFFFTYHLPLLLPPFLSSFFPFFCFHYCCVDTAVCDCCDWAEHMQDVSMMYGRLHWRWQTEVGCCHPFFLLFNVVLVACTYTHIPDEHTPPTSLFKLHSLSLPENMQQCMETDASS